MPLSMKINVLQLKPKTMYLNAKNKCWKTNDIPPSIWVKNSVACQKEVYEIMIHVIIVQAKIKQVSLLPNQV